MRRHRSTCGLYGLGEAGMSEEARPDAHRKRIEALFRTHSAAIRAVLGRLGFYGETLHDLQQDVFVVAVRHGAKVPTDAGAWLRAVARRVAANYRRRQRHGREVLDAEAGLEEPAASEVIGLRALVHRGLDELGEVEREVLIRRDVRNEKMIDIAREMGITTRVAYSRLRAARERLRRAILGDG
jgi:RNA polymerase sigma factor (sigma-70 family)